jgi:hypothetical protein
MRLRLPNPFDLNRPAKSIVNMSKTSSVDIVSSLSSNNSREGSVHRRRLVELFSAAPQLHGQRSS